MWKGSSQELCEVGGLAVRWLAFVTSFVLGISCGAVIVEQIEVITQPHPLPLLDDQCSQSA